MAASKKPRGFGKFTKALRTIVGVDKEAVDRRMERGKRQRIKRRRKK